MFELSPPTGADGTWTETVLHSFKGGNDGSVSYASLIADSKGNLYGTTAYGGGAGNDGYGYGTVFELSPPAAPGGTWTETVLHTFTGGSDGAFPFAGLIADKKGNLYGTADGGGASNAGVVFELSAPPVSGGAWTETVLHAFTGGNDGGSPYAGLIADTEGNLYGTTFVGGIAPSCCGTVFKLSPPAAGGAWTETVLYALGGDKAESYASLVADSKGDLFGTTLLGGTGFSNHLGTVFELTNTGFVTEVPFAGFKSNLEIQFGRRPNKDAFELLSEFTLGSTSTGFNLLTDPVTLMIGTYTATIASASFRRERDGQYYFAGRINGVDLEAALAQTGEKRFEFAAAARKADLAGTTNPVPVTLTIGNNSGTDTVKHTERGW